MEPAIPQPKNFRSMDAVRAVATCAIVALHAATPYVSVDLPHLLWPVKEQLDSFAWPDCLFWIIRCFARGTLFLIAGYASCAVIARYGAAEFIKRRCGRLALPLIAGTFTILMLMYVIWSLGWVRSGLAEFRNIIHFRFPKHGIQAELYGFAHLWFLWYLLLVSIAFGLLRMLLPRFSLPQSLVNAFGATPLRWLMIAIPVATVVHVKPEAIFDFRNGFIPRLDFLAYHVPFFIAGCFFFGARESLAKNPRWWLIEPFAAIVSAFLLCRVLMHGPPSGSRAELELAGAIGAVGAFASCALVSWSFSTRAPAGRRWEWLANNSFFIYLWHLPFVGAMQILVYELPLPVIVKTLLALAAGITGAVWIRRLMSKTRYIRLFGE